MNNEKCIGNLNGYDIEREEKKNIKYIIMYDGCGKVNDWGVKNVMINFDELEMSVYRLVVWGMVF